MPTPSVNPNVRWAELLPDDFKSRTAACPIVCLPMELVEERQTADHALKYEISQLLYLRPDLVDMKLLNRRYKKNSGGQWKPFGVFRHPLWNSLPPMHAGTGRSCSDLQVFTGWACSFNPRAPTTLRIVSKAGLRSPESAL